MTALLIQGDARHLPLGDGGVQCVVTSPPYWSLRDYSLPRTWWGGVEGHLHEPRFYARQDERYTGKRKWQHLGVEAQAAGVKVRDFAPEAWSRGTSRSTLQGGLIGQVAAKQGQITQRDDPGEAFCADDCGAWLGCLGLEPTPALYVEHLVQCFREIRRVLRDDGTVWLNLGDSYTSGGRSTYRSGVSDNKGHQVQDDMSRPRTPHGLKAKDLVGIPWRVAFALQADGWWLRSDIIWSKPNPMPESITDRPTKAHEYLFLLAKSERYYYDAAAIVEPATDQGRENGRDGRLEDPRARPPGSRARTLKRLDYTGLGRNRRSVWTIPTAPYPGAHFATFPPGLVRPCILAGSPRSGLVLDPFGGSGTVAQVATEAERDAVVVDPSREYLRLAAARLARFGHPVADTGEPSAVQRRRQPKDQEALL